MFILESNFGNDGYAFWFKVLELLGITDGHVYDCRNTANWEFLLAKTRVSEITASSILQKLADLDAIDKELWKDRLIWSDNFVKNLLPLYSNRKSDLPQKPIPTSRNTINEGLLHVETHSADITTDENPQSKVKERKVKESKEEKEESHSHEDAIEILKFYESRTSQSISAHHQLAVSLAEKYSLQDIKEAITVALEKGKKEKAALTYADGILKNWQIEGKPKAVSQGYKNNKPSNWNLQNQRPITPELEQQLLKNSTGDEPEEDVMEMLRKYREGG